MARKDNFVKSLALLGIVVGIAFFAFENRKVFADKLTKRQTTSTGLAPAETPLTTPNNLDPITQPSELNKQQTQLIEAGKTPAIVQQTPTQIVQQPQTQTPRIQTASVPRSQTKPLVLKPQFLAPKDILNPKAFNKRKFGIDADITREALKKSESSRTITERKQLEADKARLKFDSSKISNF